MKVANFSTDGQNLVAEVKYNKLVFPTISFKKLRIEAPTIMMSSDLSKGDCAPVMQPRTFD